MNAGGWVGVNGEGVVLDVTKDTYVFMARAGSPGHVGLLGRWASQTVELGQARRNGSRFRRIHAVLQSSGIELG